MAIDQSRWVHVPRDLGALRALGALGAPGPFLLVSEGIEKQAFFGVDRPVLVFGFSYIKCLSSFLQELHISSTTFLETKIYCCVGALRE